MLFHIMKCWVTEEAWIDWTEVPCGDDCTKTAILCQHSVLRMNGVNAKHLGSLSFASKIGIFREFGHFLAKGSGLERAGNWIR